jgi:hypothetical protein
MIYTNINDLNINMNNNSNILTSSSSSSINNTNNTNNNNNNTNTQSSLSNILYSKNQYQEHNSQLIILLSTLVEGLNKLPVMITKSLQEFDQFEYYMTDNNNSNITINNNNKNSIKMSKNDLKIQYIHILLSVLEPGINNYKYKIDCLLSQQLLLPLINCISEHIKISMLLGINTDTSNNSSNSSNNSNNIIKQQKQLTKTSSSNNIKAKMNNNNDDNNLNITYSIYILTKYQIPELFRVYLQSLPNIQTVIHAQQELIMRIQYMYISYSSLLSCCNNNHNNNNSNNTSNSKVIMSENIKMRIIADLTSIDETLQLIEHNLGFTHFDNPIIQEVK